jgi:hypothetical protein
MTEANRRRRPGTGENVSSRRINLECNRKAMGVNSLYSYPYLN